MSADVEACLRALVLLGVLVLTGCGETREAQCRRLGREADPELAATADTDRPDNQWTQAEVDKRNSEHPNWPPQTVESLNSWQAHDAGLARQQLAAKVFECVSGAGR